jgi:hypothetical protein
MHRNLTTKRKSPESKPLQFFRQLLKMCKRSDLIRDIISTSTTQHIASYGTAYLKAKIKKSLSIREILLLPAATSQQQQGMVKKNGETFVAISL